MKKHFSLVTLLSTALCAVLLLSGTAHAASSKQASSSKASIVKVLKSSASSKKVVSSSKKSSSKSSVASVFKKSSAAASCVILGNISDKKEKIFHVPGCPNYTQTKIDTTKGERIFCSESEAVAAGWRKAKNCPG